MATPHVAGAFATLRSKSVAEGLEPDVDQLLAALSITGAPITDGRNDFVMPRIQVDAAADTLWAGEPLPAVVITDNDYQGSLSQGSFSPFSDSHAYAGRALVSDGVGTDVFRFLPDLPRAGFYRISAWWPAFADNSHQSVFTVFHDGGESAILVDQGVDGGMKSAFSH